MPERKIADGPLVRQPAIGKPSECAREVYGDNDAQQRDDPIYPTLEIAFNSEDQKQQSDKQINPHGGET